MLELLSAVIALLIVLFLMPGFIRFMKDRGMIQPGYELGPDSFKKQTEKPPNMGGLVIAFSVLVSTLVIGQISGGISILLILLLAALGGLLIGFADDYIKDVQRHHDGLKPRYKLIGQTAVGLLFSAISSGMVGTNS